MNKIVFLCGARDFHAMDWYKSAKKKLGRERVAVMADIVSAEGLSSLLQEDDELIKLYIIDRWLFKTPSRIGNIWRNALKLMILPIQANRLKKYYKQNPGTVYHAHGLYYMRMAAEAGVPFVGTPQGSELLVRPYKSNFYKRFAIKALRAAKYVTVDSVNMQKSAESLAGVSPHIVQNGIEVKAILKYIRNTEQPKRNLWLTMRGFAPLYRQKELFAARNSSHIYKDQPITVVHPFYDELYLNEVKLLMKDKDVLLGRLPTRLELHGVMRKALIVFSIPSSDSSPKSVYEAIFLGCVIIISKNAYYEVLPKCMQDRIVIADLDEEDWLEKAVPLIV